MCEPRAGLSRRSFLLGCSAAVLAVPPAVAGAGPVGAAPLPGPLLVRTREDWAQGLPSPGPLGQEQPGDVRFLLVHHSASGNDYAPNEVPHILRGFHAFHTGPDKGWPDVAYNFFVDRYGTVWEGRTGSLAGPVKPDATGGSQGFAQICCFVGDHTAQAPTPEAQQAMTALLADLAQRYGIDPGPGATTTFVSRGSNRWPVGESVTTTTIAGHRDMSLTTCPGDAAYAVVRDDFPGDVAAVLAARATPPPAESSAQASVSPTAAPRSPAPEATVDPAAGLGSDGVEPSTVAFAAGGLLAAGATVGVVAHRRSWRKHAGEPGETSGRS